MDEAITPRRIRRSRSQMLTLVENCRMPGVNPETCFIDVLARIEEYPAARIDARAPQGWKESKNA